MHSWYLVMFVGRSQLARVLAVLERALARGRQRAQEAHLSSMTCFTHRAGLRNNRILSRIKVDKLKKKEKEGRLRKKQLAKKR